MRQFFWIIIVTLTLVSCASYEDIELKGTENFKMGKLEGKKLSIEFDARLLNANAYTIKVKPCDLEVFIEDQYMGMLHLNEKIKIKRKSETAVTIPLTVELGPGALLKLATLRMKKTVKLRLKGTVKGGVWFISKKEQIDEVREISTENLKLGF